MMKRWEFVKSENGWTRFRLGLFLGLGMLLIVFAVALGFRAAFIKNKGAAQNSARPASNSASASARILLSNEFVNLAKQVEGAVVNINAERIVRSAVVPPFDPFERLFGRSFDLFEAPRSLKRQSLGSGFIVDADGYILTSSQVVENGSRIHVRLSDNRSMEAVVVGADPKIGLAVLRIAKPNLPVLNLAKSDDVKLGEWVAAFGSPAGLEKTVTAGIISGKGRIVGSSSHDSYLQTDAVINSENNGGPLVNLQGEVVGINTLTPGYFRGAYGVGFAIPAATARRVYNEILKSGKVQRGWLGLRIQDVTPGIAKSFGLRYPKGVLVTEVDPAGPAFKADLRPGDIILEFNGREIRAAQELSAAAAESKVGTQARLKILRNRKELLLEVSVGERPSAIAERFRFPHFSERSGLGITVESINREIQSQLHLSSSAGALVVEVSPGSFADQNGIQPGDVIREMNHSPVNKAADLLNAARGLEEGSTVLMKIERQGKDFYLAFELP